MPKPGTTLPKRPPMRSDSDAAPSQTSPAEPAGLVSPRPVPAQESELATISVWLLDGFNILHAALLTNRDRSTWWTEEHRERLIRRVRGFAQPAEEIWLVFDGERSDQPDARKLRTFAGVPLYLVFAPSADEWLVKRVRDARELEPGAGRIRGDSGSRNVSGIAVVTRDRRVGGRTRHHGATVVAPSRFLELCQAD